MDGTTSIAYLELWLNQQDIKFINKYGVLIYLHVMRLNWSQMAQSIACQPPGFTSGNHLWVSVHKGWRLPALREKNLLFSPPPIWPVRPGKKPGQTRHDCLSHLRQTIMQNMSQDTLNAHGGDCLAWPELMVTIPWLFMDGAKCFSKAIFCNSPLPNSNDHFN